MSFSDRGAAFRGHRGFLLAVTGSAIASALAVDMLAFFDGSPTFGFYLLQAFIFAFMIYILLIGFAAALIGPPLTRLLANSGWERPWSYPLAGFIAGGAIVIIFVELLGPGGNENMARLLDLILGAAPGGLCGALWWWFDRRHAQEQAGPGGA